jgi:hypothetical protein
MDIYIYIYIYEYICAVCRVDVKYAPFKVTIVSRYRVGGYSHVNIYRYIYIYIYICPIHHSRHLAQPIFPNKGEGRGSKLKHLCITAANLAVCKTHI